MRKKINTVFISAFIGISMFSEPCLAKDGALRAPTVFQRHDAVSVADQVLASARKDGRSSLYEHEVYEILKALGIEVPGYALITDKDADLSNLPKGKKLVVKMVTQAEHKTELGGVRIVDRKNVRAVIQEMFKMKGAEAVSVYEYIQKAGENAELLAGISETSSGSVVCFGKGGKYTDLHPDRSYQAINIPYDLIRLVRSTHIGRGLILGNYRGSQLPLKSHAVLIEAIEKLIAFKKIYDKEGMFRISDLEINPLMCAPKGRLVACDGVLRFKDKQEPMPPKPVSRLERLFNPESVALIGASPDKNIGRLMRNLHNGLQNGAIKKGGLYLINQHRAENKERYGKIRYRKDIPDDADLYIIAASPEKSTDIAEGLLKKGKCVIIISGGFGEIKEGKKLQERLTLALRDSPESPVLLGPNTMGSVVTNKNGGVVNFTFATPESGLSIAPDGNMAILCQSGGILSAAMSYLSHANIKYGVSIGNALDVGQADLLEYIIRYKPGIKVIGLYIESLKDTDDADRLLKLIRKAKDKGVYVIIRKAGVTEKGSESAATHTGRPAGKFEYFKSVFEQAGAQVTADFLPWAQMLDLASVISASDMIKIKEDRVFCFSVVGADAVTMADRAGGLEMSELDEDLNRLLKSFNIPTDTKNPFDLTGASTSKDYISLLSYLATWDGCDAIVAGYLPWFHSDEEEDVSGFIGEVLEIKKTATRPIVFVIQDYSKLSADAKKKLRENGIAVFDDVESCMSALGALLPHGADRIDGLREPSRPEAVSTCQ